MSAEYRFQAVTFSDDENVVTVGGSKLHAVEGETGRCGNCTFKDGFGCSLWRGVWSTKCQPHSRQDERSITWMGAQ